MQLFAFVQDNPDVGPYIPFRAQLLCYDWLAINEYTLYKCMCLYVCLYVFSCMCLSACVYVSACLYVCVYVHVSVYVCYSRPVHPVPWPVPGGSLVLHPHSTRAAAGPSPGSQWQPITSLMMVTAWRQDNRVTGQVCFVRVKLLSVSKYVKVCQNNQGVLYVFGYICTV